MSGALPRGLINIVDTGIPTTPDAALGQDSGPDAGPDPAPTRAQFLLSFWRIYTAQSRLSRHPSDRRGEYFTWRLWSSPFLANGLSEHRIAHLLSRTQTWQPMGPLSLQLRARVESPVGARSAPDLMPPMVVVHGGSSDGRDPGPSDLSVDPVTAGASRRGPRRRPSDERDQPSRSAPSRRGRGRARPVLVRSKSSTTAVDPADKPRRPKDIGSTLPSPFLGGTSSSSSSSSSWEEEEEDEPSARESTEPAPSRGSGSPGWPGLVEPGFRTRFAEQLASSSNLVQLGRTRKSGSVVRFDDTVTAMATATASTSASASGPGSPATSRKEEATVQAAFRAATTDHLSGNSAAISDGDAELDSAEDGRDLQRHTGTSGPSRPGLPRSMSQLSTLISERRATLGADSFGDELPPSAPPAGTRSRATDKGKSRARDLSWEQLLAMGHAEGVTKSGGNPGRVKLDAHVDIGYESPPSGPLY